MNTDYILTFRYDPFKAENKKTIEDLKPIYSDPDGKITEERLLKSLESLEKFDRLSLSLSGGIDSTLLLALIRKQYPQKQILTITVSFLEAKSELDRVRKITKQFGVYNIQVRNFSILQNLNKLLKFTDEPRWNTYQFVAASAAKQSEADCIITGDGADELFCGYTHRYGVKKYCDAHKNDWVEDQDSLLYDVPEWPEINSVEDIILNDYNGKLLCDYIPTNKNIEKIFNLPVITPYLELTEFALHLPTSEKFDGKTGKIPLRNISKRYGLEQEEIKTAFSPNISREWELFGSALKTKLLSTKNRIYKDKLVKREWVLKNSHKLNDPRVANKFTQLLCMELKLEN